MISMNSIDRSSSSKNSSLPASVGFFPDNNLIASLVCMLAIMFIMDEWTPRLALLGSLLSSIPPLKHSRHGVSLGIMVVAVPIPVITPP